MNRQRLLTVVALSLLLVGLAGSLYRIHFPPGPVADEAAYVMIAQSLWHDRDLQYTEADLARAYQLWDQGPYGMILMTRDGGETMYYGKPYVYSLSALPFYALFGAQGLMIWNMVLFLAMFWASWWWFVVRPERLGRERPPGITLLLGGFFFASVAAAYVFWMQPEVFNMAAVFFVLLAWQWVRSRESWGWRELLALVAAGCLIAAAFVSKEVLVLLGLPVGIDLLWSRRWKGAAVFALTSLVAVTLLVAVQYKETDTWSPYRDAQRRSFDKSFPLEGGEDHWELYRGTSFGSWSGVGVSTSPATFVRNVWYFVAGRHVGLLPYLPFAFVIFGLYLFGPKDRSRHLLLLALVAYTLVFLLIRPGNFHGGAGFLGNRYFVSVYPALLFLPGRLKGDWWMVPAFLAAGLWTAPVVATPVQQVAPEFGLQVHARMPTFQMLPLELTLLPQGRIPGFQFQNYGQGLWVVPRENFFTGESNPEGVWVRGGSESEIHVFSPVPLEELRFTAGSISPRNELVLEGEGPGTAVVFDTPNKRQGTPVSVKPELVAKDLGVFFTQSPHEYVYRFTLSSSHGLMPARVDPANGDERFLGVFLDFVE